MPSVLLRALSEYKFVGTPLWRMSDGKDLIRVELTFHKKLPTPRYYKKGAESRRQPAPLAGEWPRQPAPATRPPPRRVPTQIERETLPQPTQTILQTPHRRPRWLSWMRRPTGDQEVAGSTPAAVGNILSSRLIMKYFLRPFSPFR